MVFATVEAAEAGDEEARIERLRPHRVRPLPDVKLISRFTDSRKSKEETRRRKFPRNLRLHLFSTKILHFRSFLEVVFGGCFSLQLGLYRPTY